MQSNPGDKLDLNKRVTHSSQYDATPPPDGEIWEQLHEQMKAKQKQAQKAERHVQHLATISISSSSNGWLTQKPIQKWIVEKDQVWKLIWHSS